MAVAQQPDLSDAKARGSLWQLWSRVSHIFSAQCSIKLGRSFFLFCKNTCARAYTLFSVKGRGKQEERQGGSSGEMQVFSGFSVIIYGGFSFADISNLLLQLKVLVIPCLKQSSKTQAESTEKKRKHIHPGSTAVIYSEHHPSKHLHSPSVTLGWNEAEQHELHC